METFMAILGLIMLVFGVLQIILFFKLWGMTNNVSDICRRICGSTPSQRRSVYPIVAKLALLGKKDEALATLNMRVDEKLDEMIEFRSRYEDAATWNADWQKYVRPYSKVYRYLGVEMPEEYKIFTLEKFDEAVADMKK